MKGGIMDAGDALADLSAIDQFLLSASRHRTLDKQLVQLEADALFELQQNPVEGPHRIVAAAGYVARLLMIDHDLDDEVMEAQSQKLMAKLTGRGSATGN
jgi:hypothetical protein